MDLGQPDRRLRPAHADGRRAAGRLKGTVEGNVYALYGKPGVHSDKVRDVVRRYGTDLNTLADEFALNVIAGQKDLDAEWDAYVAKYRKNGGDEILAEVKRAPIVEEMLKGRVAY